MIGVPAVVWLNALVTEFRDFVSFEAIMLHVIDHLQQEAAEESGDEPSHTGLPAQHGEDGCEQSPLQGLQAQKRVRWMPGGLAFPPKGFRLDFPG